MDPRHPEQAISRMRELMKQYDRIEADMKSCMVANKLAQLEREGGLVVQEICLVAPRIHEAMMQTSRQRRHDLSRGNVYEQMREYAATAERVDEPVGKSLHRADIIIADIENPYGEIAVHDAKPEEYIEMPKKKTTKKKTTKKKAEK